MNTTIATCGCRVIAVGAPGSDVRNAVEGQPCDKCRANAVDYLAKAEALAREYGSANCWTGGTGKIAAALLRMVRRVRFLETISNG